jgi:hypothetical protein
MSPVGAPLWQPGMLHTPSVTLSRQASQVGALAQPLPWAAMPRALQSWLPQPRLQVRGQASGSLSRERCGVCGWQCFPNCGRDRDNDNPSTTANATTMTQSGWLQQRQRWPRQHSVTTTISTRSQHLGQNDDVITTTMRP